MSNPVGNTGVSPYELNRDLVLSGHWLTYKSGGSEENTTDGTGKPQYTNTYTSLDAYNNVAASSSWHTGSWPSYTYHWWNVTYHGIAYANSNYGWWLREVNHFKVTGSATDKRITTNGQNGSIIDFTSTSGYLNLSGGDNVNVNAPTSAVSIEGEPGTITANAGGNDISLYTGNDTSMATNSYPLIKICYFALDVA